VKGAIVCDRIDLNNPATIRSVIEGLAAEIARSSCWGNLEVKGGCYFTTRGWRPQASAGWYVICEDNRQPLYAGSAENLNNRLNSPTGSLDDFANSKRKRDSVRNFIKAFWTQGLIGDLKVAFITESGLCDRIGITGPLSALDRGNVEKLLNVFRQRIVNMATHAIVPHGRNK
jgi:hypothetical protein